MSLVTNVVIWVSLLEGQPEEGDPPAIAAINEYLEHQRKGRLKRIDQHVGGAKLICCRIYAGAFNYLDRSEFMELVHHVTPWKFPSYSRVLIRGEEDDAPLTFEPGVELALDSRTR